MEGSGCTCVIFYVFLYIHMHTYIHTRRCVWREGGGKWVENVANLSNKRVQVCVCICRGLISLNKPS